MNLRLGLGMAGWFLLSCHYSWGGPSNIDFGPMLKSNRYERLETQKKLQDELKIEKADTKLPAREAMKFEEVKEIEPGSKVKWQYHAKRVEKNQQNSQGISESTNQKVLDTEVGLQNEE